MNIESILLQKPINGVSSTEARAIVQAHMTLDAELGIALLRSDLEGVKSFRDELRSGACLPVGSVEFVREAMRVAHFREPEPLGFPSMLRMFYCRSIELSTAAQARASTGFVKPVQTKLFNGFIHRSDLNYDDHDQEQVTILNGLAGDTPVWVSDVIEIQSEFRYYVDGMKILGRARYDQSDEENVPEPDSQTVNSIIRTLKLRHPYALDVGVLKGGQTALIELNDAWSLGLYANAMTPLAYLKLLASRWNSIANKKRTSHAHHPGAFA